MPLCEKLCACGNIYMHITPKLSFISIRSLFRALSKSGWITTQQPSIGLNKQQSTNIKSQRASEKGTSVSWKEKEREGGKKRYLNFVHESIPQRERKRVGEKQRERQRERQQQNVSAEPMSSGELVKQMTESLRIHNVTLKKMKNKKIGKTIF